MNDWLNRIANEQRVRKARETIQNLPPGVQKAAKMGATGVAVGATVFAIPPLLGFTTAGVAAGSIAAGIQSAFYGGAVSAGSGFAIMQAIGATATVVPALFAGVGAAAGVAVATEGGGPPNNTNEAQPNGETGGAPGDGDNKDDPDQKHQDTEEDIITEEKIWVADLRSSDDEADNSINEGSGRNDVIRPRNSSG